MRNARINLTVREKIQPGETFRSLCAKTLLRELERVHPGLKRSVLGALSRVDSGSLPIPGRLGARTGERVPLLGVAGMGVPGLGAALTEGLPEGG